MESLKILLGIVLCVASVREILGVQRFEQQPTYTEVNPGQDAILACKVHNKRGSCSWQKDNKPMGMYPHKYEWASQNQQNGDCSIWIRSAQLEFDDGSWECQVTASDFHTQDALTSHPVRLVVRVPPQRPRIEFNGTQILPGHNLTTLHGEVAIIKCVSHYGNPPPILKWFLDQHEITPKRQTNTTELDNPRTWLAVSVLEQTISKDNHGSMLRCVAVHESYSTKSSSIEVRLDVMFVPETRLVGIPTSDIEDLKDTVAIRCVVSANPKASVVWRREGQTQPASLQELLQFSPAIRQHSGLYTCHARNKAGDSQPVRVQVDVKYPPKVVSVGRERVKTATLFSPTTFECLGEGNPPPTYQWILKKTTPAPDVIIGREAKLHINNITYEYQGEWRCKVTNIIKGEERSEISEPIILQVHGAPQVLRQLVTPEVLVESGHPVDMSMVVCADPRPRTVAWEWGSLRLEAGSEMGKYKVDDVSQEDREDCYITTLHIREASATDSRAYYLVVENDRGTDRHAVQLYVKEPLQMGTLVSVAGALLVVFLILICSCIYAIRTEKCCFSRKGDFKPSDIDGQKVDIEKSAHNHHVANSQPPQTALGPGGIPADAIYTTGPRGAGHPDAMKHRPPTTHTLNGRSSVDENLFGYDYRSFGRYSMPQSLASDTNKSDGYRSRSLGSRKNEPGHRGRPKPLQMEHEKYYDHVFPKKRTDGVSGRYVYQRSSLDHAEL
ncbi:irregular chiasm C-roughest protein isoform X2 [Cylas formicarius]|uniref:irregular chiasm C-roughest protein isoform X2 n=1 Tax=Cylas formicarius TaxID=197179 RepID=UPI0029585F60|nr:irregular chiasm C-roughest protein isoform X2 [Cylas formicarius]